MLASADVTADTKLLYDCFLLLRHSSNDRSMLDSRDRLFIYIYILMLWLSGRSLCIGKYI